MKKYLSMITAAIVLSSPVLANSSKECKSYQSGIIEGQINCKRMSDADLEKWSGLQSVTGGLTIEGINITNLKPLDDMKYIGGTFSFTVKGKKDFINLQGMNGLLEVGTKGLDIDRRFLGMNPLKIAGSGGIRVYDTYKLETISGFNAVNKIGGGISISKNRKLNTISGFNELTDVGGHIQIGNNSKKLNITGFNKLENVGGGIFISQVDDISFLSNLKTVGDELGLSQNRITNIDVLKSLTKVGGALKLDNNDIKDLNGLINLKHVGKNLTLGGNKNIQDISVLKNIKFIGGKVSFHRKDYKIKLPNDSYICQNSKLSDISNWRNYCEPAK